PKGLRAVWQ
ncbi:hypothetical protein D039_1430B, partial [Vibrio parahaemolyticus EKP-028]